MACSFSFLLAWFARLSRVAPLGRTRFQLQIDYATQLAAWNASSGVPAPDVAASAPAATAQPLSTPGGSTVAAPAPVAGAVVAPSALLDNRWWYEDPTRAYATQHPDQIVRTTCPYVHTTRPSLRTYEGHKVDVAGLQAGPPVTYSSAHHLRWSSTCTRAYLRTTHRAGTPV